MKSKIFLCIAIMAILMCLFAISAGASEPSEESILAHIDEDGVTTYYEDYESCLNYANEHGGTVKVLKDRQENTQMQKIFAYYQNIVFDINGKVVNNVYFIAKEYSLRVIDSSADKTGRIISGGYASMCDANGSLSFDGVTINAGFKADQGTVTVENSTILGGSITSSVGTLILDRVIFKEQTFYVLIESFGEGEIKLRDADIQSTIKMTAAAGGVGYLPVSLILDEGYAFNKDGQIVCADTTSISGVTTVQHTHEGESLMGLPYGTGHIEAYECGIATSASPTVYEHEGMEENAGHKCSGCSVVFTAVVTHGSTTEYVMDIDEAFMYANTLDGDATITLIADFEDYHKSAFYSSPYTVTLDLNGHKAGVSYMYINTGSTVVVVDTSEEKQGVFSSEYENYTAIAIGGTLILESGMIEGIVELSGEEGRKATFIMNGGEILASVGIITYDHASSIINNGTITAVRIFEAMYSSASDVDYQIRGGTYPLGFDVSELNNMEIGDFIKSSGECEVYLCTQSGERVDDDSRGYGKYCVVMHSKGVITSDGTTHTGVCEACDITYLVGDHCAQDPVKSEEDETVHNINCAICSYTMASEKHAGGEATCLKKAVCDNCKTEYGEVSASNHESEKIYYEAGDDASTHKVIHDCCKALKSIEAHSGGEATCLKKAVCDNCKTEYGEVSASNHESEKIYYEAGDDTSTHKVIHDCCRALKSTEAHSGGSLTCTEQAKCEICELAYGTPEGHKYDNSCDANCNVCGEARSVGDHTYDAEGNCTFCGVKQAQPEKSGADIIIFVCIGAAVLVGIGVGGWFLVTKKKKN